jgi:hypothetical protein
MSLHTAVLSAFRHQGWQFQPVQGQEVIETYFEASNGKLFVHAQSHSEAGILTVVANASPNVPSTHLRAASELIMRTNKELNVGNFELDWDSGQVMFRVSNIFGQSTPDERIIASLVHTTVAEMDRFIPFLATLCRMGKGELLLLRVPELMAQDDLQTHVAAP